MRNRGWTVRLASGSREPLPPAVAARYPNLPSDVRRFLSGLQRCVSPKQTSWFLTATDYRRKADSAFRWNEIELMSLEFADDNPDLDAKVRTAEIRAFWDGHFPVMLAVRSDYDYLAVRLSDGVVVHGFAPDWEDTSPVAPSFAAFVSALAEEVAEPHDVSPLSVFVGAGC